MRSRFPFLGSTPFFASLLLRLTGRRRPAQAIPGGERGRASRSTLRAAGVAAGIGLLSLTPALGQATTSLGSVAMGTTSAAVTVTLKVSSAATLGSMTPYQVLTLGAPNLEFGDAGGGSCAASVSLAAGGSCTVNVNFTPQWAGLRLGAVVLEDSSGDVLATAQLSAIGTGPQIAYAGVYETIVATHLTTAVDVAVDTNHDTYIVDEGTAYVYKISPSEPGVRQVVGGNWVKPKAVALDGAGNVYVSDFGQKAVIKVAPDGTMTTVPVTLKGPIGVAVDGAGNLFIADEAGGAVYKVAPNGTSSTVGSNIYAPNFLAVDSAGDVYVGDFYVGDIYKITPGGTQTVITQQVLEPEGIAVDAAGDIYVASGVGYSQSVYEITPTGTMTTVLNESAPGDDPYPTGIALDAAGNLYVANSNAGEFLLSANVLELERAMVPIITFNTATDAGKTDTADGPQTVSLQNVGTTPLIFSTPASGTNPSYPAAFPVNASDENLCSPAKPLATTATCDVSVNFVPPYGGAISEYVAVTDNQFNQAGAVQQISVNGTGIGSDPQTITFAPIGGPVPFGTAPITLSATASSGLTVSFSVLSGPGSVNGTTLTITGAGSIVVQASQAGNSSYLAAPNVQQTLVVTQAAPTVTWSTPAAIVYGTALSATQLNASASVAGTFVYTPAAGSVLKAGAQTLSVTFTPTDATDYSSVTATVTLTVTQATPSFTWATPAPVTYGTAISATQLDATFNTPGTIVYSPAAGTVLAAGSETLTATFTPTDTTDYTGTTASVPLKVNPAPLSVVVSNASRAYGAANPAFSGTISGQVHGDVITATYSTTATASSAAGTYPITATLAGAALPNYSPTITPGVLTVTSVTPVVSWSTPASIVYGTALSAAQLDATATGNGVALAGTFSYSPALGTVLKAGTQTLSVTFTPTNTTDYTSATGMVTLTVTKATPAIAWPAPAAIAYGTALSGTQLDATANTAGTFVYSPAAGAILAPGTQTLGVTFTPADTADYVTASGSTMLTVTKATPTITWATPAAIHYGVALSSTQLNAKASVPGTFVYTPAAGSVLKAGTQTLSVAFTPTNTTDYAGTTATTTLTVTQVTPTVEWTKPASIAYGTALSAKQLDATASVPGTFAYSPALGTVLTAGTQTLSATFTPTDATDYATVTVSTTVTVNKVIPTVTWAAPAAISFGTALSATQLNAVATGAGGVTLPGKYTYSPAAGTVLAAGSYTLKVTFQPTDATDYYSGSASATLVVNQVVSKITWATPAAINYGTKLSSTQLNATANVPGTLTYTPAAGTVLAAGQQTLTVNFKPTNTTDYTSATASVTLTVKQVKPTLEWTKPAGISYGTALSAKQLNATASVPGTLTYTPALGTVLTAGTQTLSVTFTPTDTTDYTSASLTTTIAVAKDIPTVNWAAPAAITYGTPLSATQLDAQASGAGGAALAGKYTYSPAAGTILGAGTYTLKVTFTPTDATDYYSGSGSVTLTVNPAPAKVSWKAPAAIVYGTALSSTQLDATASVKGSFTYSPAAGTVLGAGTHTLSASFTPASANYSGASASETLTVDKATPVVTWATPAAVATGTKLSGTQLDATVTFKGAAVPGVYTYSPAAGTVLKTEGKQTLSVSFVPTDTTDFVSPLKATTTITVN